MFSHAWFVLFCFSLSTHHYITKSFGSNPEPALPTRVWNGLLHAPLLPIVSFYLNKQKQFNNHSVWSVMLSLCFTSVHAFFFFLCSPWNHRTMSQEFCLEFHCHPSWNAIHSRNMLDDHCGHSATIKRKQGVLKCFIDGMIVSKRHRWTVLWVTAAPCWLLRCPHATPSIRSPPSLSDRTLRSFSWRCLSPSERGNKCEHYK